MRKSKEGVESEEEEQILSVYEINQLDEYGNDDGDDTEEEDDQHATQDAEMTDDDDWGDE